MLCLLCAGTLQALCTGSDLRPRLTADAGAQLDARVAETPFARGNHWIASKGDRQIHVIGTIHTGDPRLSSIMRRLRPVIRSADVILLETTRDAGQAELSDTLKDTRLFRLSQPPFLSDLLPAPAWDQLTSRMAEDGYSLQSVARMQPWFIGFFLEPSPCSGFGATLGLDDRIERMGQRTEIPIGALEHAGAGVEALARQPLRDQARLLELDLTSQMNPDDQVVTMTEAYFEERLAEGMLVQEWTLYRDVPVARTEVTRLLAGMQTRLIDDRTRAWIPVIERTPGKVLVVAVGGAHLPGPSGLPALLAARGYRLTRAPF